MTTTDTLTDTELDAWLAEHLLGWKQCPWAFPGDVMLCDLNDPNHLSGGMHTTHGLASTGDGMILVLEALKARLPNEDIHIEHMTGTGWAVSTCYEQETGWSGWERDESLPRAVAEAARAALSAQRPAQTASTNVSRETISGAG